MKITEIQKHRYESRLRELKEEEPALQQQVIQAKELGDFSENSELDSAMADLNNNKTEQSSIINILENSELVTYDESSIINQGSMIEISCPNLNGGEKSMMLLSDSGEALLEGVLNTKSALGKLVLGNIDGEYKVNNNIFYVRKIPKPNIDEFIKQYPTLSESLNLYFSERLKKKD